MPMFGFNQLVTRNPLVSSVPSRITFLDNHSDDSLFRRRSNTFTIEIDRESLVPNGDVTRDVQKHVGELHRCNPPQRFLIQLGR